MDIIHQTRQTYRHKKGGWLHLAMLATRLLTYQAIAWQPSGLALCPESEDFNLTLSLGLFLGSQLRQLYCEHTIGHLGRDLLLIHILGQSESLLKVAVGELTAQIVLMLVFALVLHLVLQSDVQHVLFIYVHSHVLFLQAR